MKKALAVIVAVIISAIAIRLPVRAEDNIAVQYQNLLDNRETTYEWYQKFVDIINQLPEEHQPETIDAFFDEDELQLFYRVVAAEIGGKQYSFAQRVNVASVIINRWIVSGYPSAEKILTKDQFSTIANGQIYKVTVTDEVKAACQYALWFGGDYDGAIFFNNSKCWHGIYEYIGCDGAHHFYRR